MVDFRANAAKGLSMSNPGAIFDAMKNGINYMADRVAQLVECCGSAARQSCALCSWSLSDIRKYFEEGGASFREITVNDLLPQMDTSCVCDTDFTFSYSQQSGTNYLVENYTGISSFTKDSIQFNMQELMDSLTWLGSIYEANGKSFYAVITDNSVFCDEAGPMALRSNETNNLKVVLDNYLGNEVGIWVHILIGKEGQSNIVVNESGIGGNILLECNDFPQYCSHLSWIFNRLDNLTQEFYYSTTRDFCKNNSLDLIFEISDLGPWTRGLSTGLERVLRSKIVVNRISSNFFGKEVYCKTPTDGYLGAVKTILHEMVHAMMKRLLYSLPSGSYYQRYEKLTTFNYAFKFLRYRNHFNNISTAVNFTEHEILIKYFLKPHMEDLRGFNNENLIPNNSYFAFICLFGDNPWDGEMNFLNRFKAFQIQTSYEPSTIYEYDDFMSELINKLNSHIIDQCGF
ncbi:MAG: hypothetical protein EA362_11965 [Saprospirales bacterium]|nr:MAG: hypothetical protein EA362_11965 [Saprospirales bacterium]